MSDTFRDALGAALGASYTIERELTGGGMSRVFVATEHALGRTVVIKVLREEFAADVNRERFKREVTLAAQLSHPHIVSILDAVVGEESGHIAMELVTGGDLSKHVTPQTLLPIPDVLQIGFKCCGALQYAASQGIVHRDIKPANIMIAGGTEVKIADFGAAFLKKSQVVQTAAMGSPYYMAPEQWADEEPDSRADVYSLGVMFYQMLAGDVPFKGSSIPAIMKKHISDPAPKLADAGVSVPPELEAAVAHTLEKNPDRRTPTVDAFITELRAAIHPGIGVHTTSGQSLPVLRVRRSGTSVTPSGAGSGCVAGEALQPSSSRQRSRAKVRMIGVPR